MSDKIHARHQRIWSFLWHTVAWAFRRIYAYDCELAPEIEGPCLILSNHTTELDPVLVALSFPRQMYFVASEHVYRKGWVSRLLYWAFQPIAKMKGSSDALTVMKVIRTIKEGKNVCIFAEGNRSFDGRNAYVPHATGKLAKTCGATLVTYRLEGGYLTNPRWGFGIRRGKCFGHVVNVYSPQSLKEMTAEQVNDIIKNDIYEDAYERQQTNRIAYKGKKRALGIECAFCVCPRCRKIGTISSSGNNVFCTFCGNNSLFDEYGYFNSEFGVSNTKEWEDLQESVLRQLADEKLNEQAESVNAKPFFSDEGVSFKTLDSEHKEKTIGNGKMSLYADRFVFEPEKKDENVAADGTVDEKNAVNGEPNDEVLPFVLYIKDISDMSVYSRNGFVFTDVAGVHYEIKPCLKKSPLNVRKYISIWKRLRERVAVEESAVVLNEE